MRGSRRQFTVAATSLLIGGLSGCVTTPDRDLLKKNASAEKTSFYDRMPWVSKDKSDSQPEPYPNPVKLAATWTPDTLVQVGRTPTRGFGGRVFFYNEKSQPVPVDGTLTIHGFDENSDDPNDAVKRFVFTPEQLTRHYGQTDLGASYSIWLPWDAVGGEQRRISLVTSFLSASGSTIQGIPATMALPGKDSSLNSSEKVAELSPQYQNYLAATRSDSVPSSGLTTTTIRRNQVQRKQTEDRPAITIPNQRTEKPVVAIGAKSTLIGNDVKPSSRAMPTFLPSSGR